MFYCLKSGALYCHQLALVIVTGLHLLGVGMFDFLNGLLVWIPSQFVCQLTRGLVLFQVGGFRFLVNLQKSQFVLSYVWTWLGLIWDSWFVSLSVLGRLDSAVLPSSIGVEQVTDELAFAQAALWEPQLCPPHILSGQDLGLNAVLVPPGHPISPLSWLQGCGLWWLFASWCITRFLFSGFGSP